MFTRWQSPETKKSIWSPGGHFESHAAKNQDFYPYTQVLYHWSLEFKFKVKSPETKKSDMSAKWAFWMRHRWKLIGFLPIYTNIAQLKFGVDIQSQTEVRVWKPNYPIWPPCCHFESDVTENWHISAYGHHQHAHEIWNWNFKANLSYAPETMSLTDWQKDGWVDGWTRWLQYTPTQLRYPLQLCWVGV